MTDPDPKRTTDLSDLLPPEEMRTTKIPRIDDDIDPPTARVAPRKVTLTSRGRRASFSLESLTATGATVTGPLTLVLGERVALTFDVAGQPVTIVGEIVRVTIADLLSDEIVVRFTETGSPALERIAAIRPSV